MSEGFRVDLAALNEAATGVSATLEQVGHRKVSDIDGEKQTMGHDRLAEAVTSFCDRWSQGVDNLAQDAREISGRLTDCVAAYEAADQDATEHLNTILQGSGPDPAAR